MKSELRMGASKKFKCSDGVHHDEYEAVSGRYYERTIFQVVQFFNIWYEFILLPILLFWL